MASEERCASREVMREKLRQKNAIRVCHNKRKLRALCRSLRELQKEESRAKVEMGNVSLRAWPEKLIGAEGLKYESPWRAILNVILQNPSRTYVACV